MRNRRSFAVAIVALLAGGAFLTIYPGRPQSTPVGIEAARVTDHWVDVVRRRAEHGYWLVIRGTHIGDQAVAAGSAAELTHAAIYDAERGEIIEAVGSGVTSGPLRELLAQAHRLQIVRPRGFRDESGRRAVARARGHIGYRYDWLGTLGLPSDRRYYCTELCVDAYGAREAGWMPDGVIHPTHMARHGAVVFDSGPRPEPDPIAIGAELRERFARRVADVRGVDYAAQVAPGILRGGMPDAQGVEWLRARGVRTVVNLRHYHGESEGELVRAAGMRYEWIPLESTDAPEDREVDRFLAIVSDPARHPVYVHCLHGVDRTGAMIAAYRIRRQGWTNHDALAEMEHFGAHGVLHDLRHFVDRFE